MSSLRISPSLSDTAARCGVQRKAMLQKRMELEDARRFLQTQMQDLAAEKKWSDVAEYTGYAVHSISMLCDLILDSARALNKNKLVEELLKKSYDRARKEKFNGNRREKEIKKIRTVQNTVEKLLPKDLKVLADLLGNSLTNALGLAGHAEDSRDLKSMFQSSGRNLQRALKQVDEALGKLEAQGLACEGQEEPIRLRLT